MKYKKILRAFLLTLFSFAFLFEAAFSSHAQQNAPSSFTELQDRYQLVKIPTYDGSYQVTHPKVLYFSDGWNGYQYWMSMTPYPGCADQYENPSIVVSNDGVNWAAPEGLQNPVAGVPGDVKKGGHYSDPHLVMCGDTMELWYRYNPELENANGKRKANNSINIYYRRISTDGVHWSKPQRLMNSKDGHMSLCVNYENSLYKSWYTTYSGQLCYSQSVDAKSWEKPVLCTVPLPEDYVPYHQDIIKNGSKYYLLQTAFKAEDYTFQLFLLTSEDGINFTDCKQVYPDHGVGLWENVSFYRSTLFFKDNQLDLYISIILPGWKWYITKSSISLPDEYFPSCKS